MTDDDKSFRERVEEIRERRRTEDDSSQTGHRGTTTTEVHFEAGEGAKSARGKVTTSTLGNLPALLVASEGGRKTAVPLNRLLYLEEVSDDCIGTDPAELAERLRRVANSAKPALTSDELGTLREATAYLKTTCARHHDHD